MLLAIGAFCAIAAEGGFERSGVGTLFPEGAGETVLFGIFGAFFFRAGLPLVCTRGMHREKMGNASFISDSSPLRSLELLRMS